MAKIVETDVKLKYCPNCGCEDINLWTWIMNGKNKYFVRCPQCELSTHEFWDSEKEATEVWNKEIDLY